MLVLKGIFKQYERVVALKEIDLTLPDRGMVFIVGKSGSGKSTLMNILGGLDMPTSGELYCDGKLVDVVNIEDYRRNRVSFIYQDFQLLAGMSAAENVALAAEVVGQTPSAETVEALLKKVGLTELAQKDVGKLSGGEKQRVAIARGMMKPGSTIFADEPTGNLDSENGENIFKLLKEISAERLVVVVTHDEDAARAYSDYIIRIRDGKIVENSAEGAVFSASARQAEPFNYNGKTLPLSALKRLARWSKGRKRGKRSVYCLFDGVLITVSVLAYAVFSTPGARALSYLASKNKLPATYVTARYVTGNEGGNLAPDTEALAALNARSKAVYSGAVEVCGYDGVFKKEITGGSGSSAGGNAFPVNRAVFCGDFKWTPLVAGGAPQSALEVLVSRSYADAVIANGFYNKSPLVAVEGNEISSSANDLAYPTDYEDLVGLPFYFDDGGAGCYVFNISGVFEDNARGLDKFKQPKDVFAATVFVPVDAKEKFEAANQVAMADSNGYPIFLAGAYDSDMELPRNLKNLTLQNDEVIIPYPLAKISGLSAGDKISITLESNLAVPVYNEFTVKGVIPYSGRDGGAASLLSAVLFSEAAFAPYREARPFSSICVGFDKKPSEADFSKIEGELKSTINDDVKEIYLNYEGGWIDEAAPVLEYIPIFGKYIAAPLFVLCMFLLVLFTALIVGVNIDVKERELGVLKSLGARKKDVRNVFLLQTGIFIAITYAVGALCGALATVVFNAVFRSVEHLEKAAAIFYYPDNFFVVLILLGGVAATAVIWRISRLYKKTSVDIIRTE